MSLLDEIKKLLAPTPFTVELKATFADDNGLKFFKDNGGEYTKWLAVYSNSFRDDDGVPEILTSSGHAKFVNEVDAGNNLLPELWVGHEPEWKLGSATVVAVDEVEPGIVFAIAGGFIDPEKAHIAKAIDESPVEKRMSHTFFSYKRDNVNDSYDDFYVEEVSILPEGLEANPLTGFGLLEDSKMISPEKRQHMQEALGIDAGVLDELEAFNAGVANMAKEEREFKAKDADVETTDVTAEVEAVAEEAVVEEVVEEVIEEVTDDVVEEDVVEDVVEDEDVVEEDVVEDGQDAGEAADISEPALMDVVGMLNTSIKAVMTAVETIDTRIGALESDIAEVKSLKGDVEALAEAQKETKAETPATTLASMRTYESIVGSRIKSAQVDEGDELADAQPEETAAVKQNDQYGSFLGNLINGSSPS